MASSSHLMPGEKSTITVKVDTLAKKGFTSETIEVISNDPKRSKVILTLQATILENILPPIPQSLPR
jgi:hypothetical protein